MPSKEALIAHLTTGATTTCHAWAVVRKDGAMFGFTDHDEDLVFDDITFKANSGLTAGAVQRTLGLSVDNSEVKGALSSQGITEEDLRAGRFDGASVTTWLVNWNSPNERTIRFRGTLGEIQIRSGTFSFELRGLSEVLNQPRGRVYQPNCSAVLGDGECRFDLSQLGYSFEASVRSVEREMSLTVKDGAGSNSGWFERGRLTVISGRAVGLTSVIRSDVLVGDARQITLWQPLGIDLAVEDLVKLEAGCDKLAATCRTKFSNFLNFRGFPNVPSSDWVASYPISSQRNDGGSRQK